MPREGSFIVTMAALACTALLGCSRTTVAGIGQDPSGSEVGSDVPPAAGSAGATPGSPPSSPTAGISGSQPGQPDPPPGSPPTIGPPPPPGTGAPRCGGETCERRSGLPEPLAQLIPLCCTARDECGLQLPGTAGGAGPACIPFDQPGVREPACDEAVRRGVGTAAPLPFSSTGCCKPSGLCGVQLPAPLDLGCVELSEFAATFGTTAESVVCGGDDAGV